MTIDQGYITQGIAKLALWLIKTVDNCEVVSDACGQEVDIVDQRKDLVHWNVNIRYVLGIDNVDDLLKVDLNVTVHKITELDTGEVTLGDGEVDGVSDVETWDELSQVQGRDGEVE